MPLWVKAAGKWGSILAIIALVITLLKQTIAFIGFLTTAIKVIILLSFIGLFVGIGFLMFKAWQSSKGKTD
ncbi:MAG: hypothetical protein ACK5NT_11125 [Pyrinomonadaceae bacterium]